MSESTFGVSAAGKEMSPQMEPWSTLIFRGGGKGGGVSKKEKELLERKEEK